MADTATTNSPAPTLDPTLQGILDQYKDAGDKADKIQAQATASLNKSIGDVQKRDAELETMTKQMDALKPPEPPSMKDIPEAPKPEYKDPTQALGGVMSQFAIIASLFTRAPLTAGLNAAAGAMAGFHQGDKENVGLEFKRWKASVEAATAQNQKELDQYTAVLNNRKFSVDQKIAAMRQIAALNHDQLMLEQLRQGNFSDAQKLLYDRANASAKIQELWQRNQQLHDDRQQRLDYLRQQEQDRRDAKAREQDEKERANRVLDVQRAGATYNQAYPKDPITGIRKGSDGKAAPDFSDWFQNVWPSYIGNEPTQAPTGGSLLDQAKQAIAQGAPRDAVRERYIKQGGKAEDFDSALPAQAAPANDTPTFLPGP